MQVHVGLEGKYPPTEKIVNKEINPKVRLDWCFQLTDGSLKHGSNWGSGRAIVFNLTSILPQYVAIKNVIVSLSVI